MRRPGPMRGSLGRGAMDGRTRPSKYSSAGPFKHSYSANRRSKGARRRNPRILWPRNALEHLFPAWRRAIVLDLVGFTNLLCMDGTPEAWTLLEGIPVPTYAYNKSEESKAWDIRKKYKKALEEGEEALGADIVKDFVNGITGKKYKKDLATVKQRAEKALFMHEGEIPMAILGQLRETDQVMRFSGLLKVLPDEIRRKKFDAKEKVRILCRRIVSRLTHLTKAHALAIQYLLDSRI